MRGQRLEAPRPAPSSNATSCISCAAQVGSVFKHPNLRLAYVAQHAFHHLEDHLDITPNRYLHRRYAKGEDLEETTKVGSGQAMPGGPQSAVGTRRT